MIKADDKIKEEFKINDINDLKVEFFKSKKDEGFKSFTDKINLSDEYLMKYNSLLKQSYNECENCKNCKGLDNCKNEVNGCFLTPKVVDKELIFNYKTCKYKKTLLNNI